jgi:hypothetical protein
MVLGTEVRDYVLLVCVFDMFLSAFALFSLPTFLPW